MTAWQAFTHFEWADIVGILIVILTLWALLLPKVRDSDRWRATVTPLASIIGSGFLVAAPLLAATVGAYAALAMLAIVLISLWIGTSIGYNMTAGDQSAAPGLGTLERASELAIAIAYVISVAFYIRLLAAFALRLTGIETAWAADALASAVLLGIGVYGARWGLRGLERLEEYSVSIKLAIIAAMIFWLAHHLAVTGFSAQSSDFPAAAGQPLWEQIRILAGLILIVQGFETSKFLGSTYGAALRRKTMLAAQIIAGIIYVVFVAMVLPVVHEAGLTDTSESALIDVVAVITPILPLLLVVAAVMSQLSAAVADTLGAGGILGASKSLKVPVRLTYPAITFAAVVLIWSTNIFELIAIASRAFALFYFLQAVQSCWLAVSEEHTLKRVLLLVLYGSLALVMLLVVLFAKSAEA